MALFQISNDKITIQVDSLGAELKSLKSLPDQREYMWHGDPAYWGRTSPVLFPIVGGLKNGTYRVDGREYAMGQHGFARDMEFQLKSQVASEIWFTLNSDYKTLEKYPYPFQLEIGYELSGCTVIVKWRVVNQAGDVIWFSIGGHPGFLCPIDPGTDQTQYKLLFDVKDEIVSTCIDGGLAGKEKKTYVLRDGALPVTADLFDNDALVIEGDQAHSVALARPDGTPYLTVDFDAPLFGIWSPPKKKAPFICIEPWYGRCDSTDFTGDFKEREWGQKLEGTAFEASYRITSHETGKGRGTMAPVVQCMGLTKTYGRKIALNQVYLNLERGRIIGLLGPNGSGKTTLIKIMNGLLKPTAGEVLINGQRPGIDTKLRISYLPERTYLQPGMKVLELVQYFQDFYPDFRVDRAFDMLARLQIPPQERLKNLSKGTKEKVQLIMVMSRDADLYILDEPIAGVDPAARDYILHTIVNNYNRCGSILLSTHLISDVENILDEVVFIKYGSIVLQAGAEQIRQNERKSVDQFFREVFAC